MAVCLAFIVTTLTTTDRSVNLTRTIECLCTSTHTPFVESFDMGMTVPPAIILTKVTMSSTSREHLNGISMDAFCPLSAPSSTQDSL